MPRPILPKKIADRIHRGACRAHARHRASERLNITLSDDDLFCMSNLVSIGRSVECKNNRHLLRYGEKIYFVVYDPLLHTIKTIFDDISAQSALISQVKPADLHKLGKK